MQFSKIFAKVTKILYFSHNIKLMRFFVKERNFKKGKTEETMCSFMCYNYNRNKFKKNEVRISEKTES